MEALNRLNFSDLPFIRIRTQEDEANISRLKDSGVDAETIEKLETALAAESPDDDFLKNLRLASLNPRIIFERKNGDRVDKKRSFETRRQNINPVFEKFKDLILKKAQKVKLDFTFVSDRNNKKTNRATHPLFTDTKLYGDFEQKGNSIKAKGKIFFVRELANEDGPIKKTIYYGKVNSTGLPDTGINKKELGLEIELGEENEILLTTLSNFRDGEPSSKKGLTLAKSDDVNWTITLGEIDKGKRKGKQTLLKNHKLIFTKVEGNSTVLPNSQYSKDYVSLRSNHSNNHLSLKLRWNGDIQKGRFIQSPNNIEFSGTRFLSPDRIIKGTSKQERNKQNTSAGSLSVAGLKIEGRWVAEILIGPFKIQCPEDHFIESINGSMLGGKLGGNLVINYRNGTELTCKVNAGKVKDEMEINFPDQSKYLGELLFPENNKDIEHQNLTREISQEDLYYFLKYPEAHRVFFANPFKLEGRGTLLDADNEISFDGLWKLGEPFEGQAGNHPINGVLYSGPVVNYEFHGYGRITNEEEGYEYEGDLVNSEFNGQGTLIQGNKVTEGLFKDNCPQPDQARLSFETESPNDK